MCLSASAKALEDPCATSGQEWHCGLGWLSGRRLLLMAGSGNSIFPLLFSDQLLSSWLPSHLIGQFPPNRLWVARRSERATGTPSSLQALVFRGFPLVCGQATYSPQNSHCTDSERIHHLFWECTVARGSGALSVPLPEQVPAEVLPGGWGNPLRSTRGMQDNPASAAVGGHKHRKAGPVGGKEHQCLPKNISRPGHSPEENTKPPPGWHTSENPQK